jgi:AcrR family transcriptional regulator
MESMSVTTRPGGRSARVRADVHRAVGELVAEAQGELTLPVIATRAGVHPTTLYRRWGSLGDLLEEVAISRFSGDIVVPDTGSLRGDLERWAADVATDLNDPDSLALIRAAIGSGPDGGCACLGDRHEQLKAMIEREQERGGPVPTVDRAADTLLGALYYRALFSRQPMDEAWIADLVGMLLK